MGYLFSHYFKPLLIFTFLTVPFLVLLVCRTDYAITLKGDTELFKSVVEIDTQNEEKGSFSTIFVINMEHSTIFQNIVISDIKTVESYKMSSSTSHISDFDSYTASKIQYYSSIELSLILAYNEAMKDDSSIKMDYSFSGYDVTYYDKESGLKIGDRIIGVNDVDNSNISNLANALNTMAVGSIIKIIRNNNAMELEYNGKYFSAYSRFDIDYDTMTPKAKFHDNMIGGPSGGLLQTLSIYNRLTKDDLTHGLKIAGTGTISLSGKVGAIGGIKEKIPTAVDDGIDVFFCVGANYDDALEAYNSLPNSARMKLIRVETFYDCLDYLKEGYKNDFPNL